MQIKTQTKEYWSWCAMRKRCYDSKDKKFHHYGGRGIKVCERWHSYENFYKDMGDRPEGMTLDRIDNDKDYGPDNCKWSTKEEQQLNRSCTRYVSYKGETRTLLDVANELGIKYGLLKTYINRGKTVEDCINRRRRAY